MWGGCGRYGDHNHPTLAGHVFIAVIGGVGSITRPIIGTVVFWVQRDGWVHVSEGVDAGAEVGLPG